MHAQWYVCLMCAVSIELSSWSDQFSTQSVRNPSDVTSVLSCTSPCIPQTSSCEDTDVQSGSPLIRCSGREACVSGSTGKWVYQGVHTQVCLPAAWSADHMTVRPVDLWLFPTSVDCLNPSVGSYPSSHPGHLSSRLNPAAGASALQEPCTSEAQKGRSVQYLVLNAPAPTLAKQSYPWTVTFQNITRFWRMEI